MQMWTEHTDSGTPVRSYKASSSVSMVILSCNNMHNEQQISDVLTLQLLIDNCTDASHRRPRNLQKTVAD